MAFFLLACDAWPLGLVVYNPFILRLLWSLQATTHSGWQVRNGGRWVSSLCLSSHLPNFRSIYSVLAATGVFPCCCSVLMLIDAFTVAALIVFEYVTTLEREVDFLSGRKSS